jgi:hypothetical protein
MKPRIVRVSQIATAALSLSLLPLAASGLENAQTSPASGQTLSVPAPKPAAKTVWMSHEAGEVLKLVRANVAENVVMAFIESSKTGFNLSADEIVQLHNEGVSDSMIQAMLARKKQAPQATISVAPDAAQSTQAVQQPQQQIVVQQQPATVVTQPTVTYVQSEPVYVGAPTTYVYREPYYSYYNSYPYYWGSSYWYPRVSFNFGWRGGYYGGHYRYGGSWGHYSPVHHYGGFRGGHHR